MFAVLKTGGKQYKVAQNDVIVVEKLAAETGSSVELDHVLMIGENENSSVGNPIIKGAKVLATVLEQKKGKKVTVFKKKRRKNYRRTVGHRQDLTVLRITDIEASSKPKRKTASRTRKKTANPTSAEIKTKD